MHFGEYTRTVKEHFMDPQNNYIMRDAHGVGEAGDPACGDVVNIYIKVQDERIVRVSFAVQGCVGAIASSSMTTVLVHGKTLDEAMKITPQDIADALGGLPEHKIHCSVLGAEAVQKAIEDYRRREALKAE